MSKLLLLFALLFTALHAEQESFPFIGVSISTQTIELENRANLPKIDDKSYELRYGKQTTDLRTIFAISGNGTFQSFSIEVDKILLDDMFGFPQVRPYLGGVIGYMHYDGKIKEKVDTNSSTEVPTSTTTTTTTVFDPDTNQTTTQEVTTTTPVITPTDTTTDTTVDPDAPFLESNDGYFYGANFGFLIYAGDNLDIDISYHYYKIEGIEPIDYMHGATFGINYFY